MSVLSTNLSPEEVTVRRTQKDGSSRDVPCPLAIKVYNRFMGGVDKNDQLRGYYSVRTKSRKSYKYLFWFLFDVAIVNSFILYGLSPAVGRKKTLKEFRVELAHQLIGSYNSHKYGGPGGHAPPQSLSHQVKRHSSSSGCHVKSNVTQASPRAPRPAKRHSSHCHVKSNVTQASPRPAALCACT